ncbi:MAG: hypothetical protein JSV11_01720, partial [Nitrospiraceae bacterium]
MMKGMKKFTKVTALSLVVFMFVLVLGIQSADATAMLKLYDGTYTILVEDGCTASDIGVNPNCN